MVMAIMSYFIKVALSTFPIKTVFNSMQVMETNWHIKEDSYFFCRAVLLT